METLIVICLLIIIYLLLHDKILIKRVNKKDSRSEIPDSPEIMGRPKLKERLVAPSNAIESQNKKTVKGDSSFDPETEKNGFNIEIPLEELDEVFCDVPDLDEEEEEWRSYGAPNGEDGFATGVTFEELSTVGTLLQQDVLEPALQQKAVGIVQKIQGTELFSLLENSMEGASRRIAALLDKNLSAGADYSSSNLRNKDLEGFDIGEFV